MPKHSEKIIFLAVVVAGAFLTRGLYPKLSLFPQSATATQTVTGNSQDTSLLTLPTIGESSTATYVNGANDAPAGQQNNVNNGSVTTPAMFQRVGNSPLPALSEQSSLVADLTTGAIFSSLNADRRWPTASLTKLMTASVVLDNIATSTEITITPAMFAADPQEFTLVVGGTYTVEDLLHLLLMPSSNVAAEAMANYFGRDKFMAQMNARAEEWGMQNTYFDDPSGISAANESTANDFLILAQHVYNDHPEILAITRTSETTITNLANHQKSLVKSINDFAGAPGFIGGKTGHTTEASGNLLSIFSYHSHPVVIVVMGTTDRFADTSKLLTWFKSNFQ